MITINVKPLSVNKCWMGRRFKTKDYLNYEKEVLLLLPMVKMPKAPYLVDIHYYFSSVASDLDNPTKPLLDIMQKKYSINDKDIYELRMKKSIVKKGQEKIEINIQTL